MSGTAPSPSQSRLTRRQTHAARSGPAVLVVLVLLALLLWMAVELALDAASQPQLLVEPADAAIAVGRVHEQPTALLATGGVLLALLGVVLLALAVGAGRLPKHTRQLANAALVVDDRVLAGSISDVAARAANVPSAQVRTSVGRKDVRIDVTPLSGAAVDRAAITQAAEALLAGLELRPSLRVKVAVASRGVVGS